jgi:ABC-type transporter MlaC component
MSSCMKLTRRSMLGSAVASIAVLVSLPALPASANGTTPAEQAAHVAANRFLELVRNGGSRDSFADLLGRHVSVQQIAMFALGKYRRAMPPKQRQTYVNLVNDMLLDTVTKHGKQVRGQAFVVTGSQGNIVKGYIQHASGKQTTVDLRMVENRVADVRVQGIWMGFMLRQEFNRIIDNKGGNVSAIFAYLKNGETH